MTDITAANNLFIIGIVIAVTYFVIKILEIRFIETESRKPMKTLIRDTVVVCVSSIVGVYVLNQFNVFSSTDSKTLQAPSIFTDNPGF